MGNDSTDQSKDEGNYKTTEHMNTQKLLNPFTSSEFGPMVIFGNQFTLVLISFFKKTLILTSSNLSNQTVTTPPLFCDTLLNDIELLNKMQNPN